MFLRRQKSFAPLGKLYQDRCEDTCKDSNMETTSSSVKAHIYGLSPFPRPKSVISRFADLGLAPVFRDRETGFVKSMGHRGNHKLRPASHSKRSGLSYSVILM